jgi:glycosyltransferase involved in cell wall biosynthesis
MTASPEPSVPAVRAARTFDPAWREAMARAQEAVLPAGRVFVSCSAPLGVGGLGRHVEEIVDALRRTASPTTYLSGPARSSSSTWRSLLQSPRLPDPTEVLSALPVRVSPGVRMRAFTSGFDARAARGMPRAEHVIAFNGQALRQFAVATSAGYESRLLVSANSHLRRVARQHALARAHYPLERSWTTQLVKRNLREYARADRIYVASSYVRDSFRDEGFADELISEFPLTPDPRYARRVQQPSASSFDIVYVGSLAVHKGVPLLIDAFRRLPYEDMRLRLVGGWGSRGMRQFVQRACAGDRRISVCPGDPLPHLRAARLCVHPAYEDGFGYAPAEALACGVPVIVSEDTGMKDLIDSGRTGLILATGELNSLTEAIEATYRGELLGG